MSKKRGKSEQMAPAEFDTAFDQWVSRQLHKVYDEVLNEPVPEELLRLVERLDAPRDSSHDPAPGEDAGAAAEHLADGAGREPDETGKG